MSFHQPGPASERLSGGSSQHCPYFSSTKRCPSRGVVPCVNLRWNLGLGSRTPGNSEETFHFLGVQGGWKWVGWTFSWDSPVELKSLLYTEVLLYQLITATVPGEPLTRGFRQPGSFPGTPGFPSVQQANGQSLTQRQAHARGVQHPFCLGLVCVAPNWSLRIK